MRFYAFPVRDTALYGKVNIYADGNKLNGLFLVAMAAN